MDSDNKVVGTPVEHYTDAQPSLIDRPLRTLKFGDAFAVLDSYGDVGGVTDSPEGVYLRDTRYMSLFELTIEGNRPLLLSSVLEDDNASLTVALTNPEIRHGDLLVIPRDVVAIDRTKLLFQGSCYERIGFCNYGMAACTFSVRIRFAADFRDLFEVRGTKRKMRGTSSGRIVDAATVELRYEGLDDRARFTTLAFSPTPRRLETGLADFTVSLRPGEKDLDHRRRRLRRR